MRGTTCGRLRHSHGADPGRAPRPRHNHNDGCRIPYRLRYSTRFDILRSGERHARGTRVGPLPVTGHIPYLWTTADNFKSGLVRICMKSSHQTSTAARRLSAWMRRGQGVQGVSGTSRETIHTNPEPTARHRHPCSPRGDEDRTGWGGLPCFSPCSRLRSNSESASD